MQSLVLDQAARTQAIQIQNSYIVQAPAGSGKTELLTQRFLNLLSVVDEPESILAITFTRKAAAEMKQRIIEKLTDAKDNAEPDQQHGKITWRLTKQVLTRDSELGWHLCQNPNRLRIMTIDSLCATLTRQMPLLSQSGLATDIANQAQPLYEQAIDEVLASLATKSRWQAALQHLLLHLDHNYQQVKRLLCDMLAKRDQWLPLILQPHSAIELRQILETNIARLCQQQLTQLIQCFSATQLQQLWTLTQFRSEFLPSLAALELPDTLQACREQLPIWQSICESLITKTGSWRKSVTKTVGFPAPSSATSTVDKKRYTDMKQTMLELIVELAHNDDDNLADQIFQITQLPPQQYRTDEWHTLAALIELLPIIAAKLKLTFNKQQQVDYTEIAISALAALGEDEAPTDLSLSLDYKIQHILVDEFQDTSTTQFQLLEKLTAGWSAQDGRSLFIVGDPMQSIYRFREAEVGLFLRAQQQGIGAINLIPLQLNTNFRSSQTVIEFINRVCGSIFPKRDDIFQGAVSYTPAYAFKTNKTTVTTEQLGDELSEANRVVELIQQQRQQQPEQSIAILVRARAHLDYILPALRQHSIPYQAIDIDCLASEPVILDLLCLTKAMIDLTDRISWLSLLRSPLCGLTLSDLHQLVKTDLRASIWTQIKNYQQLKLSEDGIRRLARIYPIINYALQQYQRLALADWIKKTWYALGGTSCYQTAIDTHYTEQYFNLLNQFSCYRFDPDELDRALEQLFANQESITKTCVQVMTIHKAKGLEFDCVILPSLHKITPTDAKQLMIWLLHPQQHSVDLLLAPIHDAYTDSAIYTFLRQINKRKADYEQIRLLYVALTRAKHHLHLLGCVKHADDETSSGKKGSFLALLQAHFESTSIQTNSIPSQPEQYHSTQLLRLTANWQHPTLTTYEQSKQTRENPFSLRTTDSYARGLGSAIHKVLEQISTDAIADWTPQHIINQRSYWYSLLARYQIQPNQLQQALAQLQTAIEAILSDPVGRWILSPHQQHRSEVAFTARIDDGFQTIIIDRCFIDAGVFWIIDYKTSLPAPKQTLAEFIQLEAQQYHAQLRHYQQVMQPMVEQPIQVSLYFPQLRYWHVYPKTETEVYPHE